MKKRIKSILVAAVFLVPIASAAPVYAVTGDSTNTSNTTTTNTTTTKPTTTPAEEALKRISAYKAGLKTKLTTTQQTVLKTKCKPAQSLLKGISTKGSQIETNRTKLYTAINKKLEALSDKLRAAGKTAEADKLDAALVTAKTKADKVVADIKTYNQTLTDLLAMDCATDPTAFEAALQTARTQRQTVVTDSTDLRTFMLGTMKTVLQQIHDTLNTAASTGSTTNTTTKTTNTTTTGGQ